MPAITNPANPVPNVSRHTLAHRRARRQRRTRLLGVQVNGQPVADSAAAYWRIALNGQRRRAR
jgi:hypothetical protein